ncbi:hypothetical protein B0H11DRAFT_1934438 [Mycena galericulata]|nr:hypothetical protein B0H11DRAFT_1934438 [Mycena galericulata]
MPAASPLGLRTSLHMHTALCPTVWLGRPPPFIRLAGLHGSGVLLHSSAWLVQLRRPPPFIRLACAAPASPSVHPPGWLARLRRPPPFIRLAGLRGSGVPRRSSAWLACAAPASPSIHLPGWLARLRRPPPFICLGLHGSGILLPSSAWACTAPASPSVHPPGWLARLWLPPPFIRLPSQTDSHSIYFITGGGGPNGHVHSQGQGGLWIYPHCGRIHTMDTTTCGCIHRLVFYVGASTYSVDASISLWIFLWIRPQ